jgi:hypothetical protein
MKKGWKPFFCKNNLIQDWEMKKQIASSRLQQNKDK